MSKRMFFDNNFNEIFIDKTQYTSRNYFALQLIQRTSQECNADVLKIENYLCNEDQCIGSINGRPLYYDGDHMSEFGNELLEPMFKKVLTD
jgi:hypothetical protein